MNGDCPLEIADLTVEFRRGSDSERALDSCSLAVREGEIHAVIGLSGAGKTVLGWCALGRVPPPGRIVGGRVTTHGFEVLSPTSRVDVRGRGLGLIPPTGKSLLNPTTTIGSQIVAILRQRPTLTQAPEEAAVEVLRRVGIPDPRSRFASYPHELSGGMAQRAVVAVALASAPSLLVADEMTANLDVTVQIQLLDLLAQLVNQEGLSVLYMTRDLGIVAQYCTTVSVLDKGKILETTPVEAFFSKPRSVVGEHLLESARQVASHRSLLPDSRKPPQHLAGVRPVDGRPQSERVLEIHSLHKRFQSARTRDVVHAVNGVDLTITPGETVALVGESGSGKTTVGRCILRLIDPDEGSIKLGGRDVTRGNPDRSFRRQVQLVFQEPGDSLNPRWTVEGVLADPLVLLSRETRKQRAHSIARLLELVGLPPHVRLSRTHELTSGEQQLVAIARAIAPSPRLIVLDEPTSRLDSFARHMVMDVLRRVQEETGVAYLFISHDLLAVETIADRIIVMYLGKVVEEAAFDTILDQPVHPYSMALLSTVLYPDPARHRPRFELQGEIPSPIALPTGCALHPRCPVAREECATQVPELEEKLRGERGTDYHLARCLRVPRERDDEWIPWAVRDAENHTMQKAN